MRGPADGDDKNCCTTSSGIVDSSHEALGAVEHIDLDVWRGDLGRLRGSIDHVVQSFFSTQLKHLDAVTVELATLGKSLQAKERDFTELSDSIANFVEEEGQKLECWGLAIRCEDGRCHARGVRRGVVWTISTSSNQPSLAASSACFRGHQGREREREVKGARRAEGPIQSRLREGSRGPTGGDEALVNVYVRACTCFYKKVRLHVCACVHALHVCFLHVSEYLPLSVSFSLCLSLSVLDCT